MRARVRLFSVVACLACSEREAAARLDVEPDTLTLYGRDYSWVTVNRIDPAGTFEAHGASLTARDTSVVRTSGTSLACLREGTTTVDVTVEQLTSTFVARCEFATRLDVEQHLTLEAGGAAHSLTATAIFPSGNAKVLSAISARVNDTAIVAVRDGAVVPIAIGQAGLRIDYGGVWSRMSVNVRHTISNDSVSLVAGQTREWRLEPGRYAITVQVKLRQDLSALKMETERLRCSRDPRDEDTIHCVADQPAEIKFRNTTAGSKSRPAGAFVRIVQVS